MPSSWSWESALFAALVIIVMEQVLCYIFVPDRAAGGGDSSAASSAGDPNPNLPSGGHRPKPLSAFAQHSLLYIQLQRHPRLKTLPSALVAHIFALAGTTVTTTRYRPESAEVGNNGSYSYLQHPIPFLACSALRTTSTSSPAPISTPTYLPVSVTVTITTRDQGWSSYPSERGTRSSHTWGDLRVVTLPPPTKEPVSMTRSGLPWIINATEPLYRNIHAGDAWETITKTYPTTSEIVQTLRERILSASSPPPSPPPPRQQQQQQQSIFLDVRVSAQYPGWVNRVQSCKIDVHWALEGYENLVK